MKLNERHDKAAENAREAIDEIAAEALGEDTPEELTDDLAKEVEGSPLVAKPKASVWEGTSVHALVRRLSALEARVEVIAKHVNYTMEALTSRLQLTPCAACGRLIRTDAYDAVGARLPRMVATGKDGKQEPGCVFLCVGCLPRFDEYVPDVERAAALEKLGLWVIRTKLAELARHREDWERLARALPALPGVTMQVRAILP